MIKLACKTYSSCLSSKHKNCPNNGKKFCFIVAVQVFRLPKRCSSDPVGQNLYPFIDCILRNQNLKLLKNPALQIHVFSFGSCVGIVTSLQYPWQDGPVRLALHCVPLWLAEAPQAEPRDRTPGVWMCARDTGEGGGWPDPVHWCLTSAA